MEWFYGSYGLWLKPYGTSDGEMVSGMCLPIKSGATYVPDRKLLAFTTRAGVQQILVIE
jgi:hypothetical protein